MRHVKLPGKRQSFSKRGAGHTPGSAVSFNSTGGVEEEKEVDFVGVGGEVTLELPDEGGSRRGQGATSAIFSKNVAFDDGGKAVSHTSRHKTHTHTL